MSAKERLAEAVAAMRDVRRIPAAEWERPYPTFVAAMRAGGMSDAPSDWQRVVDNMSIELALRTAEFLLSEVEQ